METEDGANDVCRLTSAIEITRNESLKTQSSQGFRRPAGLVATLRGELSGVVVALDEPQFVPRTFAVTHEGDQESAVRCHDKQISETPRE